MKDAQKKYDFIRRGGRNGWSLSRELLSQDYPVMRLTISNPVKTTSCRSTWVRLLPSGVLIAVPSRNYWHPSIAAQSLTRHPQCIHTSVSSPTGGHTLECDQSCKVRRFSIAILLVVQTRSSHSVSFGLCLYVIPLHINSFFFNCRRNCVDRF